MTLSEKLIWFRLRGKQLTKFRFRRGYHIGPYLLDFYCPSLRLAVEIGPTRWDEMRDRYLAASGVRVLRFSTTQVYNEFDDVIQEIKRWLHLLFRQGTLLPKRET